MRKLARRRAKTNRKNSRRLRPVFPQLQTETEVWRFLDLAKLIDSMSRQHLYMTRLDRMHDKFEGSISPMSRVVEAEIVNALPPRQRRFGSDIQRELIWRSSVRRLLVSHTYVSCWRHGEEIEAMWRLYCGKSEGIAMRTTYGKLRESISGRKTHIGAVRYIDYHSNFIDTNNLLTHLLHKRKGFAHEQEVRVVRQLLTSARGDPPEGVTMPWNIGHVVEEIVVSPYAGQWYFDCVQALVKKFCPALGAQIRWSSLYGDPLY